MTDLRPEFAFIDWIAQHSASRPEVRLGIGDDTAILAASSDEWVVTKDVITCGVHFEASTSLRLVGRKALAVNISDIAAMAARPVAAFIGIVLPRSFTRQQAEELYAGLYEMAREWNISIAGGDTNSWDGELVVSVTLMGQVAPGKAIRRSGALPGDWIFVTGPLGGSFPSGRHFTFQPRIDEALRLRELVDLHAMLDLSDGLGSDLFHLLDRSAVGARINGDAIPIHPDVDASQSFEDRLQHAISDGEDFELLFTVSAADGRRLVEQPPSGLTLTWIGEIVAERTAELIVGGQTRSFTRSGWSHQFGGTEPEIM